MKPLHGKDNRHILAAEGWLELGDYAQASSELDEVTPELRGDPEVIGMRCLIYRAEKKWSDLLLLSEGLAKVEPGSVGVWLHQAEALHNLGRTEEAIALLTQKVGQFSDPTYPYHLACYTAKLGRIHEAETWLKVTFENESGLLVYRRAALENPDFEALWKDFEK